jgi:hypothetical protein
VEGTPDGSPEGFFLAGGALFFVADDGLTGRELWAVEDVLSDVLFDDGFESGDFEAWSTVGP